VLNAELGVMAKSYLCNACYPIYRAEFEPHIKFILRELDYEWQSIDASITAMCLKHMGAFRNPKQIFYSIDNSMLERFKDQIDATIYRQFKNDYRYFIDRLKYLRKNGVIGHNLYQYLNHLSQRKSKAHRYHGAVSDADRILYFLAEQLLLHIKFGMVEPSLSEMHRKKTLAYTERQAKKYKRYLKIGG
jgi:hypothetical protein